MRSATPDFAALDLEICRAWAKLLKADSRSDIDKWMTFVDALLDQRLLLAGKSGSVEAT